MIPRELQEVRQALGKAWFRKLIRDGVDTQTAKQQATLHADAWTRFFVEAGAKVIDSGPITPSPTQKKRNVDIPNRQLELT